MSLLVHKYNNELELIFFDSRNLDYLQWSEPEIDTYIKEHAKNRIAEGKIPFTNFKLMIQKQSIQDTQKTIDLLINCILGNTTLFKYNNDRRLDILYTSIQSEVPFIKENFIMMNYDEMFTIKNNNIVEILEGLNRWINCNYSAMKKFFLNFHGKFELDEDYNMKLMKFLDYFRHLYKFIKDEKAIGSKFTAKYPYLMKPLQISALFDHSNL